MTSGGKIDMSKENEPREERVAEAEETVAELPEGPETPEELRTALEEERARAEEYLDQWKRARAEFANFKKRNEKEREELLNFANSILIAKILPILDDFERALRTIPDKIHTLTWVEGIFLIHRKLQAILEQEGVSEIEAEVGKEFDPTIHEAVVHEDSKEYKEGQIVDILQKGYKLHDRVVRPTLVKVAKEKSAK